MKMKTWMIYETLYPIVGDAYEEFVGRVDATTETSALNKAKKMFKVYRGGVFVRRRKAENFVAKKIL